MTNKQVNVAMIGLGFGSEFIPIYQAHPNANVYAICQRNKEHLNTIGDRFKIDKRFTDYAEVLKDPKVDFVHINSPISDHASMSMQALKAGKHVMCTVPMATTVEECRQICELVKQTGLKYMRGGALHFTQDEDFLCLLGDEQLIAIFDEHILRHARPSLHDTIDIDDQSADRLQLPELCHQLLPNGKRLCPAGSAVCIVRQRAAGYHLERQ